MANTFPDLESERFFFSLAKNKCEGVCEFILPAYPKMKIVLDPKKKKGLEVVHPLMRRNHFPGLKFAETLPKTDMDTLNSSARELAIALSLIMRKFSDGESVISNLCAVWAPGAKDLFSKIPVFAPVSKTFEKPLSAPETMPFPEPTSSSAPEPRYPVQQLPPPSFFGPPQHKTLPVIPEERQTHEFVLHSFTGLHRPEDVEICKTMGGLHTNVPFILVYVPVNYDGPPIERQTYDFVLHSFTGLQHAEDTEFCKTIGGLHTNKPFILVYVPVNYDGPPIEPQILGAEPQVPKSGPQILQRFKTVPDDRKSDFCRVERAVARFATGKEFNYADIKKYPEIDGIERRRVNHCLYNYADNLRIRELDGGKFVKL